MEVALNFFYLFVSFWCLWNVDEKTNNDFSVKRRSTHFGSFYLRVGAISFGIGTMVYSGLEFGQYFELNRKMDRTIY